MRELKAERIREMTEDDIRTKIRELKEELFHLRFRNQMRQLSNPLLLRVKKRDVARLETVLAEHRMGIRPLAAPGAIAGTPGGAHGREGAEAPAGGAAGRKKIAVKRAAGRGSKSVKSGPARKAGRSKSSSGKSKGKRPKAKG